MHLDKAMAELAEAFDPWVVGMCLKQVCTAIVVGPTDHRPESSK